MLTTIDYSGWHILIARFQNSRQRIFELVVCRDMRATERHKLVGTTPTQSRPMHVTYKCNYIVIRNILIFYCMACALSCWFYVIATSHNVNREREVHKDKANSIAQLHLYIPVSIVDNCIHCTHTQAGQATQQEQQEVRPTKHTRYYDYLRAPLSIFLSRIVGFVPDSTRQDDVIDAPVIPCATPSDDSPVSSKPSR